MGIYLFVWYGNFIEIFVWNCYLIFLYKFITRNLMCQLFLTQTFELIFNMRIFFFKQKINFINILWRISHKIFVSQANINILNQYMFFNFFLFLNLFQKNSNKNSKKNFTKNFLLCIILSQDNINKILFNTNNIQKHWKRFIKFVHNNLFSLINKNSILYKFKH